MTWRKSSYSDTDGNCVEVRGELNAVRDSKDANGPVLTTSAFRDLVRDVKAGRFDR
ncbi:MAG: DUF397 domain-containing protein [Actinophytocola sp.]|uniref:DUF397 domain-containing protein n=1 Tax=Actinophytocola sp. TaxID=1872138 RepID=UPI003C76D256